MKQRPRAPGSRLRVAMRAGERRLLRFSHRRQILVAKYLSRLLLLQFYNTEKDYPESRAIPHFRYGAFVSCIFIWQRKFAWLEQPGFTMIRLFCLSVTFIVLASDAFAADLLSRKAPENPRFPAWTGFYVGVNSGAVLGSGSINFSAYPYYARPGAVPGNTANDLIYASTVALTASAVLPVHNNVSFIGGAQIGHSWSIEDRGIFSLEADAQGLAGSSSHTISRMPVATVPNANDSSVAFTFLNASRRLDYLGTIRGRLGYLINPAILIYATAGLSNGFANLNALSFQAVIRNPTTIPSNPRVQINYGSAPFNGFSIDWTAAQVLNGGMQKTGA